MKRVVLLGSTGSIGASTIKVAEDLPDRIQLVGLAAGNNLELLVAQARKHHPAAVCLHDPRNAQAAKQALANTEVYSGAEGLLKMATRPDADIVLIAIVGTAGLQPALAAIRAGKDIAVASKEILVMAGRDRDARSAPAWGAGAGGGQRTLGDFPMPGRQAGRFGARALADGFGRAVPRLPKGEFGDITVARALQASVVGDGQEDHD